MPSSRELAKSWPYPRHESFIAGLKEAAEQWFRGQGYTIHPKHHYSLASWDDWQQNIICADVADYISKESERHRAKKTFPLHKYLHNGLSSQAMTFNLVGPLIVRKDLNPLRVAIEGLGVTWPQGEVEAAFEYSDREIFNEDSGQPTSIDIALLGSANSLFIEAKLTEQEFGRCSLVSSGNCDGRNPFPDRLEACYLDHIGRKYWQKFAQQGFSQAELAQGVLCPFSHSYQFFREVMFAFDRRGSFILLHDERNPAFLRSSTDGSLQGGLWPLLYEAIPAAKRSCVGRLTIQNLVIAIEASGNHDDWIGAFKKKYALC